MEVSLRAPLPVLYGFHICLLQITTWLKTGSVSFLEDFHCQCHALSYYAYPLPLAFGFHRTNRHFLQTSSMDVPRPQFKSILKCVYDTRMDY